MLKVVPVDDTGTLDVQAYETLLGQRTKLVALAHVSNALGSVNPVGTLIAMEHQHGIPVLLDGGVRRGTDVFKALALGAKAVGIGRPMLWGLGAFGEAGVERVLTILQAELKLTMGNCGTPRIADTAVSTTGRARSRQVCRIASRFSQPSSRSRS